MIPRNLEPEIMDTAEESAEYDAMDHSEVNRRFVADFLQVCPNPQSPILDVGTGTALIPIELCRANPNVKVIAQDASREMLEIAKRNVENAGLSDRITVQLSNARALPMEDKTIGTIISNSIIHHISEPEVLFAELARVGTHDAVYFVRDLLRPSSVEELDHIVQTYAGESTAHQRKLFRESLYAALTLDEVRALLTMYEFNSDHVQVTSDRHWTWASIS